MLCCFAERGSAGLAMVPGMVMWLSFRVGAGGVWCGARRAGIACVREGVRPAVVAGSAVGDEHFGVGEVVAGVFALLAGGVGGAHHHRRVVARGERVLAAGVAVVGDSGGGGGRGP